MSDWGEGYHHVDQKIQVGSKLGPMERGGTFWSMKGLSLIFGGKGRKTA